MAPLRLEQSAEHVLHVLAVEAAKVFHYLVAFICLALVKDRDQRADALGNRGKPVTSHPPVGIQEVAQAVLLDRIIC